MTSTHNPKDQRIFYKECISLKSEGYDVTLVEQGNSEECSGVHIVGTLENKSSRFYRLLVRPRKIYKLALKVDADIYQFHDMELIPYGNKLKRKGKKVIFDYHEDYASRFAESDALQGPKWLKNLFSKVYCNYENRTLKKFDALISVTPHICERLKKINSNTEMVTNYPLVDHNCWNKEILYNNQSDYIGFAGQVSETYCLSIITKAIQDIPGIKFKICGPERKNGDLQKLKLIDSNNKLNYVGKLPYNDVPDFIGQARAAMILSTYGSNTVGNIGTLGNNKLFEAMLCGVPVICTDYILWKEIVDAYHCGLYVNSYDQEQIRKAVEYILSHADEAKRMGQNGHKAVMEQYNWNTQKIKLIEIYNKIRI